MALQSPTWLNAATMYGLSQLRRGFRSGLDNPAYFGRELNRLFHRRLYTADYNRRGVDVMAEDWDNLLILDACRYDDFARFQDLPGELESRISRGSHTMEFLRGNFAGRDLLDTVYVTASPQFELMGVQADFHAVDQVWDDDDAWDEEAGTVRPETMAARARQAAEAYPNKRLVIHFVQPHYPFLDTTDLPGGPLKDPEAIDIWGGIFQRRFQVSAEEVRAAYRKNLRAVLPSVAGLLGDLEGKSVVTADHGNVFGERSWPVPIREWGHPPGIYVEQLVRVPWLVYGDERREVFPEPPTASSAADSEMAKERLQHLGYVD